MAKKIKNDWLGGRVDDELKERVAEYIEAADMTMGQLIRKAVEEYMRNHPAEEV